MNAPDAGDGERLRLSLLQRSSKLAVDTEVRRRRATGDPLVPPAKRTDGAGLLGQSARGCRWR